MRNSNGGSGLAREERLQIMLSPEELKVVDNFRFAHRMPSRAAAVREGTGSRRWERCKRTQASSLVTMEC